jgi:uncharacterized membrane protein
LGVHRSEHTLEIDAPPSACFDALVDYESFPQWQAAVEEIEVLDRHPDGLARDVRVHIDAKVRRFAYTLRYSYERPNHVRRASPASPAAAATRRVAAQTYLIGWDYVGGDVEHVEGEFRLEPLDDGERTRATYALGIDPGFPAPALVVRRLNGAVMKRSVEDLKREVERRADGREPWPASASPSRLRDADVVHLRPGVPVRPEPGVHDQR